MFTIAEAVSDIHKATKRCYIHGENVVAFEMGWPIFVKMPYRYSIEEIKLLIEHLKDNHNIEAIPVIDGQIMTSVAQYDLIVRKIND